MIGGPFNLLFRAGDVIYGISFPRGRYSQTLEFGIIRRSGAQLMDEGNYTICDHYNNRTFNVNDKLNDYGNLTRREAHAHVQNHLNTGNTYNQVQRQALTNYYNSLKKHKYNPHDAMNVAMSPQKRLNNANLNDNLAFRRACKFGLDYFILTLKRRVHFILDIDFNGTSIDFEKVVNKELFAHGAFVPMLPITYSELRRCYKKRHQYGDRIFFYLNLHRVPAPWDQNPDLWHQIDVAKQQTARHRIFNFLARRRT